MEKERIPMPIDGKNISEDWIYDLFEGDVLCAPYLGYGHTKITGYIGTDLVSAQWGNDDNTLLFFLTEELFGDGWIRVNEMVSAINDAEDAGYVADVRKDIDKISVTFYEK